MEASDSLEKSPDLPPELFQNDVDFATGVSAFFFLPVLVAALTSAEEFNAATKSGCQAALSHFARSDSCFAFPDPSSPPTTTSFPGYSRGLARLVSRGGRFLGLVDHFEPDRFAEHRLERRDMPVRGPQFQLRVSGRAQAGEIVVAARVEIDSGQSL